MDATVYLAKEGKVSGPFDSKKIEEMKASGEFYRYEWMWDGQSPDWSPVPRKLHSPPALPDSAPEREKTKTTTTTVSPAAASSAAAKPFKNVDIETSNQVFYAVLFDSRTTLGGEVSQAHSRGGKFISGPTQATPFSKGSTALVDLLDEKTDRSAKVQAQIGSVSRMGDRWMLELEWASCPLIDS
jgi:hypothetical protein